MKTKNKTKVKVIPIDLLERLLEVACEFSYLANAYSGQESETAKVLDKELDKIDDQVQKIINKKKGVSTQPFEHDDLLVYLEMARVAFADADIFDAMAEHLDLCDKEMCRLMENLQDYLGEVPE
jgi:hypothetical protein